MDNNAGQTLHPPKWRETCDPFSLPYHSFELKRVLGYPHAGNDVFYAEGIYNAELIKVYIKVLRNGSAGIMNEAAILSRLDDPLLPKVIDHDNGQTPFIITAAMQGERLSTIVGENAGLPSIEYMEEYGEALAKMHKLKISAPAQADRRFYHIPQADKLKAKGLPFLIPYFANGPGAAAQTVFCHGDFHYANVLWTNKHISAMLDFELSGYGNRDFDIAWAIFLRPGQKFLKTEAELKRFLAGYSKQGNYSPAAVRYYMAQCYAHFLDFCNDADYCEYAQAWLNKNCQ